MEQRKPVICPENEGLEAFMWQKIQEMAERPKGISENIGMTLSKAYSNVCNCKNPITTLKELSHVKGVGKWIVRLVHGYFEINSAAPDADTCEQEDLKNKGKKTKGTRRYVPQKNSVAYSLLITLYRGIADGKEYMLRQELIDAAEASGLSRVPIGPEKGKGKPWAPGSSSREWYSGWSCMKALIAKGLVAKSNCPANWIVFLGYMLTQEGHEAARECISRSGLADPIENAGTLRTVIRTEMGHVSDSGLDYPTMDEQMEIPSAKRQKIPNKSFERFLRLGYSKEQIQQAFDDVSETYRNKDVASLWPAVLCRLREDEVYGLDSAYRKTEDLNNFPASFTGQVGAVLDEDSHVSSACDSGLQVLKSSYAADSAESSLQLRACSSLKTLPDSLRANLNVLSAPPLTLGDRFEDVYEVILVLDSREQFASHGSKSKKLIDNMCSQFKIKIEVRRLPVGDGVWIARHRHLATEYILDFIVERKNVDDLRCSIRDNRYKDQKLRLLRCGLKKLIYLVEGDANSLEASESIKTACFTTEVLEGFDVQRTSGLGDTMRKYGYLTQAITQYYSVELPKLENGSTGVCPLFDEFIKRCQDLEKITVSDVFSIQLMQVPQVTEEVAIAILDLYPTLLSLAHAYSLLDGDSSAQEDMLRKQTNNVVSEVASKNIFQLVWSG